jgi:hypothetical protein
MVPPIDFRYPRIKCNLTLHRQWKTRASLYILHGHSPNFARSSPVAPSGESYNSLQESRQPRWYPCQFA